MIAPIAVQFEGDSGAQLTKEQMISKELRLWTVLCTKDFFDTRSV